MSKRDIVLAELAELDKCKDLCPRGTGWWLPREVYKFRSNSLVTTSDIPAHSIGEYLRELHDAGLAKHFLGQTEIYYRINGDGLKALEETSARAEEEMVLRVAKWAYNEAMRIADYHHPAYWWDCVSSDMKRGYITRDPRVRWIEGARKTIRGDT